jgi:hypothetical protein
VVSNAQSPNLFTIGNFANKLDGWLPVNIEGYSQNNFDVSKNNVSFKDNEQAGDGTKLPRVLILSHQGRGQGTLLAAYSLQGNRNRTLSLYAGARVDATLKAQASIKTPVRNLQGLAYIEIQYATKSSTRLGSTILVANPPYYINGSFSDKRRFNVIELNSQLQKYSFNVQEEIAKLPGINPLEVESILVAIVAQSAGMLTADGDSECNITDCKSEVYVAEISLR